MRRRRTGAASLVLILIGLAGYASGVASTRSPSAAIASVGTAVHVTGGSYTDVTPRELAGLLAKKSFA